MDIVERLRKPDHSFDRNSSHTEQRYVCMCDHLANEAADEIERLRLRCKELNDLSDAIRDVEASQAREGKLREALEYASEITKPEGLSGCDCPICTALTMPTDDTALREANERYLNESPEIELLNRIYLELLDDLDFKGDMVDGIKELVKQAKKETLLEAANLLFESTDEPPINGNQLAQMRVSMIAEKLRYLAEEVK